MRNKFRDVRKRQIRILGFDRELLRLIYGNGALIWLQGLSPNDEIYIRIRPSTGHSEKYIVNDFFSSVPV
ncbi:hypothetical protein DU80_14865 [Methanosarcina mazei]|uniref:Uncharacterized protein n=1 Tax=Methanosarcina mazei TaxID=2209 RepID=A0A0F8F6N0_METMZ|nr:hypothetical protein [Methanosarcina mazei]KKG01025.1 hypothetical protein DU40_00180 [Methanosarcina mazei]KKG01746.1 hypothetical protein DU47_03455 [Methanosarcina mazei]KKG03820.1 hypothetical protein DU31_04670 [Methanosarcina mazei]KKG19582.1 hypothetical protein DU34_08660 [Methanosarcina mazei]KKG30350.1 hypothetical protein DU49_10710 [Methanosarcina mazei]